jgi:hypothetical protein
MRTLFVNRLNKLVLDASGTMLAIAMVAATASAEGAPFEVPGSPAEKPPVALPDAPELPEVAKVPFDFPAPPTELPPVDLPDMPEVPDAPELPEVAEVPFDFPAPPTELPPVDLPDMPGA